MAYFVYLRVSSTDQANSGLGLEAQEAACRSYVEKVGGDLGGVYCDAAVSGAKGLEDRPGLLAALSGMGRGDVLLVAKRDRMGRDPLVVAMIEAAVARKKGQIVSAAGEGTEGTDPSHVLMRRMVDAFAEYERLIISARTKAAMAQARKQGRRIGDITYGYRLASDGRHLEPVKREQATVTLAKQLRGKGLSYAAVAQELENRGHLSRKGTPFYPAQVWRMVA